MAHVFPPESIRAAPLPELPFFLPLLSRIACASALPSNYAANDVDPLCERSNFPDIVKLHRKIFMLPPPPPPPPTPLSPNASLKFESVEKIQESYSLGKKEERKGLLGRNPFCSFWICFDALFFDPRKKWNEKGDQRNDTSRIKK